MQGTQLRGKSKLESEMMYQASMLGGSRMHMNDIGDNKAEIMQYLHKMLEKQAR